MWHKAGNENKLRQEQRYRVVGLRLRRNKRQKIL